MGKYLNNLLFEVDYNLYELSIQILKTLKINLNPKSKIHTSKIALITELNAHVAVLFSWFDLVDVVFFAECVEDDVDLIEHVHHLHRCDVDADLIKLDHIAEQDGNIRKDLGCSSHTGSYNKCGSFF